MAHFNVWVSQALRSYTQLPMLHSAETSLSHDLSAVFCRGEIYVVDVGSPLNAVFHIVLKLPWIALHFLRCLLVQWVVRVGILQNIKQSRPAGALSH